MKSSVKAQIARHRPWDVVRFVVHLPQFAKLFLRLLADNRVAVMAKVLLVAAGFYVVSPLDFMVDVMPLLGQMDDLAVFAMACRMFIQLCPKPVVDEHVAHIDQTGQWSPF